MSIEEAILEAVRALPEDKKLDVLQLANKLRAQPEPREHLNPRGMCSDLGPGPTKEEIDEVRREMWRNFPREDMA